MTIKTGESPQGEEGTVSTAFSVWRSDEDSELDHGVGGLDPAQQDQKTRNGPPSTRERPPLFTIVNPKHVFTQKSSNTSTKMVELAKISNRLLKNVVG